MTIRTMSVHELVRRQQANEDLYLLDVRQPAEHALVSLPGSTLIPLTELPGRLTEVQPPPGATIVVYCHHGIRSMHGAAMLMQAGIANVYSLAGGIDAWSLQVDPTVPRY
jgi:rhodanese-related sulfurtransferase